MFPQVLRNPVTRASEIHRDSSCIEAKHANYMYYVLSVIPVQLVNETNILMTGKQTQVSPGKNFFLDQSALLMSIFNSE